MGSFLNQGLGFRVPFRVLFRGLGFTVWCLGFRVIWSRFGVPKGPEDPKIRYFGCR